MNGLPLEREKVLTRSLTEELRSGWTVLLSSMLGCGAGMIGLSIYGLPFLAAPIAKSLSVTPGDITIAGSFFVGGLLIAGPLIGRLADRIGPRRVVLVSIVAFALMLAIIGRGVSTIWEFYGAYFALALLGGGTTYAIYARVVSGWFDRARGLALGCMMSGPGLSAVLLPFILPPVIAAQGWRSAYLVLALIAIMVFPLIYTFVRPGPVDLEKSGQKKGLESSGLSMRQASGTRQFWAMVVGSSLVASAIIGTHLNMVGLLSKHGFTGPSVAVFASIFGIGSVFGRVVVGVVLDRVHGPVVGAVLFLLTAGGMITFAYAETWPMLLLGAATLGLSSGAEGDLTAYLAGRYFGIKSFSEIYGWIYSAIALGLMTGPPTVAFLLRQTGDYQIWLLGSAAACIAAAALFLTLGPYPNSSEGR